MAKARPVPLDPSEPYREAAARVVEARVEEVFDHEAGVLDTGDIERVHDMRVATRRLRAVLEIFAPCFPARAHRAVLREVKTLADALGERRDPDVQIAALESFEAAMPAPYRGGARSMADAVRAEQGAGNARLEAALAHVHDTDLRGRAAALVAAARSEGAA
jgi:CHAD domain-containing protein